MPRPPCFATELDTYVYVAQLKLRVAYPQVHRTGFYPLGGGHVSLSLAARANLRGIHLTTQGTPVQAEVYVFGGGPIVDPALVRRLTNRTKAELSSLCPGIRITTDDTAVVKKPGRMKQSCVGVLATVVTR